MFADRLLETVWAQGSWRGWMTLTSSGLKALAAAFLFLLPLMGTAALPQLRPLSPPVSVAPPPGRTPRLHIYRPPQSLRAKCWETCPSLHGVFQSVSSMSPMNAAPPQLGSGPYVPGSTGSGDTNKILNSIGTGVKPALPPPPPRQLPWYDYRP
jgi:hypothetical protein